MRRCDQPGGFAELLVKRLQIRGHAVHVGEAMQIHQRRAVAGFEHIDLAAPDIKAAPAHAVGSGVSCRSMSGNSRANSFAELSRSRGATSAAKRCMLLRVSASAMLPRWNWIRIWPTLVCSRISMMRRYTVSALPTMIEADCCRSSQFSASPKSGEVGSENFR